MNPLGFQLGKDGEVRESSQTHGGEECPGQVTIQGVVAAHQDGCQQPRANRHRDEQQGWQGRRGGFGSSSNRRQKREELHLPFFDAVKQERAQRNPEWLSDICPEPVGGEKQSQREAAGKSGGEDRHRQ